MTVHYYEDCGDEPLGDDDEVAFDAHEVTCERCKALGL